MRRFYVVIIASILLIGGVMFMVIGHTTAVVSGQFARWDQVVEEQHRRFASAHGSGGPSVPLHVPFMCCVPLLFPAAYAFIAIWRMLNPITCFSSRWAEALIRVLWAAWCAGVIVWSIAFGILIWDELQWEWPGFFLQSAGAWLSVAGHGLAAVLGPDRD